MRGRREDLASGPPLTLSICMVSSLRSPTRPPVAMTFHGICLQMTRPQSSLPLKLCRCVSCPKSSCCMHLVATSPITSIGSLPLSSSLSPIAIYLLKKLGDLFCRASYILDLLPASLCFQPFSLSLLFFVKWKLDPGVFRFRLDVWLRIAYRWCGGLSTVSSRDMYSLVVSLFNDIEIDWWVGAWLAWFILHKVHLMVYTVPALSAVRFIISRGFAK